VEGFEMDMFTGDFAWMARDGRRFPVLVVRNLGWQKYDIVEFLRGERVLGDFATHLAAERELTKMAEDEKNAVLRGMAR